MKKFFASGTVVITVLLISSISYAQFFCPVPKGTIKGAYAKYNDSDTVTVTSGYGECNGEYWEILADTDHDMTSLATAEDFHYIYIDDSESAYPAVTIIDDTTEPAWDGAKQGWYNGDDRCIGVVWSESGSATVLEFGTDGHGKYFITDGALKLILDNGAPNGAYQTIEATAYSPVNTIAVLASIKNRDSGSYCNVQLGSVEASFPKIISQNYGDYAQLRDWIPLQIGWSRDLKWYGEENDDDLAKVAISGYEIER